MSMIQAINSYDEQLKSAGLDEDRIEKAKDNVRFLHTRRFKCLIEGPDSRLATDDGRLLMALLISKGKYPVLS